MSATVIPQYAESLPPEETIASKQQDLQDAQQIVAGNDPEIASPPDTMVVLPRGLRHEGAWHTESVVRELTGADEEVLARQKNNEAIFTTVLALGVERIGKVTLSEMPLSDRMGALSSLLVGEREQLFLRISIATYGDTRKITYTCPACLEAGEVPLTLSQDIKLPVMADPYTDYEYTTSKGRLVKFRLATGADQEEAAVRPTLAEQNTILLSECIISADGSPLVDPIGFARNLSMRDRQAILEVMTENQPNPDMGLLLDCPKCGFNMSMEVAWGDIFRS